MNLKSEQLRSDLSLEIEYDDVLSKKEIINKIMECLGKESCTIKKINGKKVLCFEEGTRKVILLCAAVTYLGGNGQHPLFKKRMQLPSWYKDFCNTLDTSLNYDVKFIGVYHYQGHIVFIDFIKDTYLNKKMHNSAAHVYINDIFQASKSGVFRKIDRNNNLLFCVKYIKFKDYLLGNANLGNDLFELFAQFNYGFTFGQWITAINAIQELHDKNWKQWRQTEWAGWFLEYKFDTFTKENNVTSKMKYIGDSRKGSNQLDFDIWFDEQSFYGDLKASDIVKKETPGNDQSSFLECINMFDKFWYVIYEHETLKDAESGTDFEATRFRNNYIRKIDGNNDEDFDELSYYKRMKHSVKFMKMFIIEINRINYREILSDFNQGKQPDGKKRQPKFLINKRDIDNFVVFRYNYNNA